jgi:hypothetical protein
MLMSFFAGKSLRREEDNIKYLMLYSKYLAAIVALNKIKSNTVDLSILEEIEKVVVFNKENNEVNR